MNYDFADTTTADDAARTASGRAGRAEAPAADQPSDSAVTRASEPARGPRSTARGRLETANLQLRAAVDDMERFKLPIDRLRTLINAVDAAERELEVHRQAHLAVGSQMAARPISGLLSRSSCTRPSNA
jgi:hypothetical protein